MRPHVSAILAERLALICRAFGLACGDSVGQGQAFMLSKLPLLLVDIQQQGPGSGQLSASGCNSPLIRNGCQRKEKEGGQGVDIKSQRLQEFMGPEKGGKITMPSGHLSEDEYITETLV